MTEITKSKGFFNDALTTGIEVLPNTELAKPLLDNISLSELNFPVNLIEGEVKATGNQDQVQFKGLENLNINGSTGMKIAFLNSSDQLNERLSFDKLSLEIPDPGDGKIYALFVFEYNLEGSVEGEWPLGKVTLSAGLDSSLGRKGAMIISLDSTIGLRDAIKEIITSIKNPRSISTAADIKPGTWFIIDRDAALNANVGAQVGLDFDWTLPQLGEGLPENVDIQAKLGAELKVGFNLVGEFDCVISRPGLNESLRVQIRKKNQHGRSFAGGINALVKGDFDDYEDITLSDIVRATLGIHHAQILDELRELKEIKTPEDLVAKIPGLTEKLLEEITETEIFDEARNKILDLITKWDNVGKEGASKIYEIVERQTDIDLGEVKKSFEELGNSNVKEFLEGKLEEIGGHNSPFIAILESVIPFDDILDSADDSNLAKALKKKATQIAELLDLEVQLKKFQQVLNRELSIDKIKKAANGDLDELGEWLNSKLSKLVKEKLSKEIEAISKFVENVTANAQKFLDAAKKALRNQMGFSLAYAYQKQSEHSSMIDVNFNFELNKNLSATLEDVLDGDYDEILTKQIAGLTLNKGSLSHGIKKQHSLSLTVPGVSRNFRRINESFATGNFIQEEDGRLIMYDLNASDKISKGRKTVELALFGSLSKRKKKNEFKVERESLKLGFNFKLQDHKLKTVELIHLIKPFIESNLSDKFPSVPAISSWLSQMERQVDKELNNGLKFFGPSLINMQLRVPGKTGRALLDAPEKFDAQQYNIVSYELQKSLREVTKIFLFNRHDRSIGYDNLPMLYAGLLYVSLPPISTKNYKPEDYLKQGSPYIHQINRNLAKTIAEFYDRMINDPDEKVVNRAVRFSKPQQIIESIWSEYRSRGPLSDHMLGLIGGEQTKIRRLIKAATKIKDVNNGFRKSQEKGLEELAKYGSNLTEKLNEMPNGLDLKMNGRFVALKSFFAIASALDPSVSSNTTGCLEIMVLNHNHDFNMESYLKGELPDKEDLIFSQKIVDLT